MPRVVAQLQVAMRMANLSEISDFLNTTLPGWCDAASAMAKHT